ncbi:MAG TPA: ABC transporter ATP-binding protein [Thiobacillaceae bacterium]|nr:ABC transporter ATP-binding protein [Thiobacillaceae bacterium]
MKLQAEELSWQSAAAYIVRDVSLHVADGELVGLIGPNGSGKSTLLRMIYRVLQPDAGRVVVDSHDVWQATARDNARRMAVLAQEDGSEFSFNAREVVLMGRTPHKAPFTRDSKTDFALVEQALRRVGAVHLAGREFATLSGGEKQRVLIARALVQQAGLLVLDEPTNHLDVRYQFEIMNLLRGLGTSAIAALHELHIAAHYCDRLYLLEAGRLVAHGTPAQVLTAETIASVYRVRANVSLDPRTDKPHIDFLPDEAV